MIPHPVRRVFVCLMLLCASVSRAAPPGKIDYPPLKFSPPKIERAVLKCGATVFLLPDPELPLINLSALFRAGSMDDPPGKTGLASLTAALLRGGGTRKRRREELDEALESTGASVETGMDVESAGASLSCLKKDFDGTLAAFAEILRSPSFDAQKLEVEKAKAIEGIRRRNDEPFDIARRQYRRSIYGLTHPLSRTAEIPGLRKISRGDLMEFHGKYYGPGRMMIAVSGDFVPAEMARALDEVFAGWKGGEAERPRAETVKSPADAPGAARRVVYAEKDVSQCSVILGRLGVKRHDPDRFALEVMNEILGGSAFSSRLYKEIRTRLGLAYWVGTSFSEPWDYGTLAAACQTKSKSVGKTIDAILEEMGRMTASEVSVEELEFAKESISNSFVFRFGSSHAIVTQKMSLEYHGYPPGYLETYVDNIRRVSAGDVLAAAKKYLRPEKMTLIVVGDQKDFDAKLEDFGRVEKADLRIGE